MTVRTTVYTDKGGDTLTVDSGDGCVYIATDAMGVTFDRAACKALAEELLGYVARWDEDIKMRYEDEEVAS